VGLFVEDLQHGFVLGLIDLGEGFGNQWLIVETAVVEHLGQAEGGVAEQNLGVLEAPVVVGHGQVDFMGQRLHLLQEPGSFLILSGGVLMKAELGHLVHKLGIEEALLARLGLEDFRLEGVDALLVDGLVVKAGGVGGLRTKSETSRQHC